MKYPFFYNCVNLKIHLIIIEEIKTKFVRMYEGIVERRGLPILFGRVMAIFILEGKELNQKEISELTGYSISTISRTLDQMIQMGLINKYKNPSREYFLYEMKTNFLEMAIGGLEMWTKQAEASKNEIRCLRTKIEKKDFNKKFESEVSRLLTLFNSLEEDIELLIEIIRKIVDEVKKSE